MRFVIGTARTQAGLMLSVYAVKKQQRWLAEFGPSGLWRLHRSRHRQSLDRVHLCSRKLGTLALRNRIEDFEAVNTVICFGAYRQDRLNARFGSVLDLGANIGIATRYFLAALPGVPVLAIEPCAENCDLLQDNLRLTQNHGDVRVWQCAVGPVDGVGRLRHASEANTRLDSLRVEYGDTGPGSATIPVCSISRAVQNLEPPILVKMDIEGAEASLLEARTGWTGKVGRMMIEFHDSSQENYWVHRLVCEGWRSEKCFDTWHFWRPDYTQ